LLTEASVRRASSTSRAVVVVVAIATPSIACAPPPELAGHLGGDGADAIDVARLDRDAAGGACGFPSAGDAGYGVDVGHRLANNAELALSDCDGDDLELADFFCERDDGDFNRGILISIGAGWCGPCQEETLEFAPLYEEFHPRGIEVVQVLFQDWNAQAPTTKFCNDWRDGQWIGTDGDEIDARTRLPFPIALDQVFAWTGGYLSDPASAVPMNILVDANGNIRWKIEGQKPDPAVLRSQFELVIQEPYAPPS
jgi:thiol-disulfide isomerase/thioredoxin